MVKTKLIGKYDEIELLAYIEPAKVDDANVEAIEKYVKSSRNLFYETYIRNQITIEG